MDKKEKTEDKVKLPARLNEFRTALEKEIEAVKKSGQSSTLLYGGKRVMSNGSDFWYSFNVEYMPDLPADTPCKLTVENNCFDVNVIQVSESQITISSGIELPENIGKAKLENGSTVLMERLIKRIEENRETENPAADRMFITEDLSMSECFNRLHSYSIDELIHDKDNNYPQNAAVQSAINNNITYIWGPPGTGKTTVIKDIILNLLKQKRSVLLVSHTNTAVDGAIKKVDETYYKEHQSDVGDDEQYPILRLGNFSRKDLSNRIKIESHIKQAGKELQDKKEKLTEQRSEFEKEVAKVRNNLLKFEWVDSNNISSK